MGITEKNVEELAPGDRVAFPVQEPTINRADAIISYKLYTFLGVHPRYKTLYFKENALTPNLLVREARFFYGDPVTVVTE